jgi:outer membrane lipoprotein-sorting protein
MKLSRFCASIQPAVNEKPETSENIVLYCLLRGQGTKSGKSLSQGGATQTEETVDAVFFEVVRKSGELVRVLVRDPGGVTIEFHFTNWIADPPLEDSIFHFSPPSGVAIVNGELPTG